MDFMQIVDRMERLYVSDTGLGRIDPKPDDSWIAPNGVESVNNENGILFRAYALAAAKMAAKTHEEKMVLRGLFYDSAQTVKTLQRLPEEKGLYNRHPGGYNQRKERHDNYVGICYIAAENDDEETPQAMIDWWWSHWFTFNNVEPDKYDKDMTRQGGEVALYYVAAGRKPPLLLWLWFLAGMLIGITKKHKDPPQARLTWLRTKIVEKKGVKGLVQRFLYKHALKFWYKRLERDYGGHRGILGFPEGHPVRLFHELAGFQ